MQPFNQKLPPIARPPGNFGHSGTHHVPDVSPSLDTAVLGPVEPRDKVRMLGVKAMEVAKQQADAACHGSRSIHGDLTIPSPERHRRAHDVSTSALLPCGDVLEKSRRAYEKEIGELRAATAGPSGLDLRDVRLAEIRTTLGGLPQGQRYAKIVKSIERGSDQLAAAVLGCDRFLSDFLTDLELEEIRACWAKLRMPESVARLAQLESDLSHIERTAKILISYQSACAGPPIIPHVAPAGSAVVIRGSGPPPRNRAFG